MKIGVLVYSGWPGVATTLRIRCVIIENNFPEIDLEIINYDGNINFNILRKIKNENYDIIWIGGWDNNIKLLVQNVVRPKTKVILEWCSPLTQIELGGEISRFNEVMDFADQGLINYVSLLIESDYKHLSTIKKYFVYLPVFLDFKELESNLTTISNDMIDFGLFCAPCLRKNLLVQIFALSKLMNGSKLHVNYTPNSASSQYLAILDKIIGRNNYSNHLWMSRDQYLSKIQSLDICGQVTISESFNFTAAEHMYYKVPVIMSKCSPITKGFTGDLRKLVVDNYDDVIEVESKFKYLKDNPGFRQQAGNEISNYIVNLSNTHKSTLIQNLSKVLR